LVAVMADRTLLAVHQSSTTSTSSAVATFQTLKLTSRQKLQVAPCFT
jgi:hypothetical protein